MTPTEFLEAAEAAMTAAGQRRLKAERASRNVHLAVEAHHLARTEYVEKYPDAEPSDRWLRQWNAKDVELRRASFEAATTVAAALASEDAADAAYRSARVASDKASKIAAEQRKRDAVQLSEREKRQALEIADKLYADMQRLVQPLNGQGPFVVRADGRLTMVKDGVETDLDPETVVVMTAGTLASMLPVALEHALVKK